MGATKPECRKRQAYWMKEKWTADFSKPEKACFDIKPEISFDAYLEKGSRLKKTPTPKNGALFLGVKKESYMAWLETRGGMFTDQCIEADFRVDGCGDYCAAGIMFRINGQGTYYLALVSNKGYFRLDAVHDGVPAALTGWVEAPCPLESKVNLKIIACGSHLIFLINGKWAAEAYDDSIPGGHLGFALVSYGGGGSPPKGGGEKKDYASKAWLDSLSVDSRRTSVEAAYNKWNERAENIGVENRFRLAESFAALEKYGAAHDQILKTWKQREEAARSVTATIMEMKTGKELLFAARMSFLRGQYAAAEECIDECLALSVNTVEKIEALAEKVKILSAQNKYSDLADFLPDYIQQMENGEDSPESLPSLYALLGHALQSLEKYKDAATAWGKALDLDSGNDLYTANAAEARGLAKKKPGGTKKAPAKKSGKAAAKKSAPQVKSDKAAVKKPTSKAKPDAATKTKTASKAKKAKPEK
jgi:tetratricopeptide (TPR) repeat protein